jgi:hypothetical protein
MAWLGRVLPKPPSEHSSDGAKRNPGINCVGLTIAWRGTRLDRSPLDGKDAANSVMLKVMDQIYAVSPLAPQPSATTTP